MDSKARLPKLPTELLIAIFRSADSFPDIFALAATCQGLRSIWQSNLPVIYQPVARRSIDCEIRARRFLAQQRGHESANLETSSMTQKDVVSIVKNAGIVEQAIHKFEEAQLVCRVKCKPLIDLTASLECEDNQEFRC